MFAVSALLSLSFVLSAQAAFTAAQTAFFASGDALSGGNAKTRAYDAAILANSTHALITMTATGSKIGWMAMGSGPTMVGADMVRHVPFLSLRKLIALYIVHCLANERLQLGTIASYSCSYNRA